MLKKTLLLFLIVMLIGCKPAQQRSCDPGFIVDGSSCCMDADSDNVCDSMEEPKVTMFDHLFNKEGCTGDRISLDHSAVGLENIGTIEPMGHTSGEHVTPVDHIYYKTPDWNTIKEIEADIFSPADGVITDIQYMYGFQGYDYRLVIRHTCRMFSIFIHVETLSEKIAKEAPTELSEVKVNIPVSAGEKIGSFKSWLDYSIVDRDYQRKFIIPESYDREPWKMHCADPFDYFSEPVRSEMVALNLRTAEPLGGIIDHDIDGRLIGTWFKEGTKKYMGLDMEHYYRGHLSIAYDNIDPGHVRISIGDYDGKPKQFAVKGNVPDPAEVRETKYELVASWYIDADGVKWDEEALIKGLKRKTDEHVQAVLLLELVEDRKLKFEIFPEQTAAEVVGFTENALVYER